MNKISIVIPMYNAADFIEDTLNSIYDGSVKPDQVIVIDDGSTDNSKQICKEMSGKYKTMILLEQENEGVSSARNHGIMYATGDYIWFVDADDWIAPEAIHKIKVFLSHIKNSFPDIILSNMCVIGNQNIEKNKYVNEYDHAELVNSDKNQLLSYLYGTLNLGWTVWRHLFRTEFIRNNRLYFDHNLRMFEDMDWINEVLNHASKIDAINEVIYINRFDNVNSLTRQQRTMNIFLNYVNTCIKWFRYYENEFKDGPGQHAMLKHISDSYKCAFTFITKLDIENKKDALNLYMNNFDIAKYNTFDNFDRTLLIK